MKIKPRLGKQIKTYAPIFSLYTYNGAHTVNFIKEGDNEAVEIPQV